MTDAEDAPVSRRECGLRHENVNLRIANLEGTLNTINTGVCKMNDKVDNLWRVALASGGILILVLIGVVIGRGVDFSMFVPK